MMKPMRREPSPHSSANLQPRYESRGTSMGPKMQCSPGSHNRKLQGRVIPRVAVHRPLGQVAGHVYTVRACTGACKTQQRGKWSQSLYASQRPANQSVPCSWLPRHLAHNALHDHSCYLYPTILCMPAAAAAPFWPRPPAQPRRLAARESHARWAPAACPSPCSVSARMAKTGKCGVRHQRWRKKPAIMICPYIHCPPTHQTRLRAARRGGSCRSLTNAQD